MPWISQTQFNGMISLRRSTSLPVGFCADSLNSDLGSSSQAAPQKGYTRFGNQSNPSDSIVRKFTYIKGDGVEITLQVRDDGTNYIVEYLNQENVINSADGEWEILEAGLSRTRTLSDGTVKKLRLDFAPQNDTGTDQLIYGNGVEGLRIWNGAIAEISATTATTITIDGSVTITLKGFDTATGDLLINGTAYAYTGVVGSGGLQFTGVTPDPTGEANGSGISQKVNTNTLSSIDKGSILVSAQSRLFMAGVTATPNQVTFTKIGTLTDVVDNGTPDDGGFEDFPQMNGDIEALSSLNEWIIVFSKKRILAFKYQFPTSTTRVVVMKEIATEGCSSYKAVVKLGDQVWYGTPKGGLKRITQIAHEDIFRVEDMTELIRPTIANFVWDDSTLEYVPKEKVFIYAGKSSSEVSNNDKAVMVWLTDDGLGKQSFNLGISDWFIGDMTIFKDELHFGSSVASFNYKGFDGFSKDGAPYTWRRIERVEFFTGKDRGPWTKKRLAILAIRGAIGPGTTLNIKVFYGLNGNLTTTDLQLKHSDSDYIVETSLNPLGQNSLGTEPLGGTFADIADLDTFFVKFPMPNTDVEDIQIQYETDGTGQRVSIDVVGYFVEDSEQHNYSRELKDVGL